mgnify:FL=1
MSKKISFIGLGAMGGPMATNILKKGIELFVYDIDENKKNKVVKEGGIASKNILDVTKDSDIVVTMLPATEQVKEVLLGENGVINNLKREALILDMSTISPKGTDEIAIKCRENQLRFIDAPVGRLVSHAISGESLFMVGCDDEKDFQRVKPLLDAMGTSIIRCGKVGTGIRAKVVNNFQILSIAQITAEALTLAKKLDLELDVFKEVNAGTTANNGQFHINFMSKVLKNDVEPGFTIDLAHKDMGLALEAGNDFRVGLPVGSSVHAVYGQARSSEFAKKDFSALLDYACQIAEINPPRIK